MSTIKPMTNGQQLAARYLLQSFYAGKLGEPVPLRYVEEAFYWLRLALGYEPEPNDATREVKEP